jgi:CelD/BcsL family acetyltransferase involved in cellulose biosynthesis
VRRVAFIGDGIISPAHLDIIALPGQRDAICQAFLGQLQAHTSQWDVLDFRGLAQDSPLRACLPETRGRCLVKDILDCWRVPLPDSWDRYMAQYMNHKQRRNWRYHSRRLEKEHPDEVSYKRVREASDIGPALDRLGAMQRERLARRGLVSPFADPRYIAFHQDMASLALQKGWLRLYQLKVGDEVIAVFYLYRYGDDFYGYQMSFDYEWNVYSPGALLLTYVMQEAIKEGAAALDLSYGSEGYKDDWAECTQIDSHLLFSHSVVGNAWLMGAKTVDDAIAIGRKRLPENVRERGNVLLATVRRWPVFQR